MMTGRTLVDGHVHFHPVFRWDTFLTAAARNLGRYAPADEAPGRTSLCLLMADVTGQDTLAALRDSPPDGFPRSWTVRPTEDHEAVRVLLGSDLELTLVAGRQVRTEEGLEVLALATDRRFPDGAPFQETLESVRESGAVCVVPWGLGKWWGSRGKLVEGAVAERQANGRRIFLGDSGVRPRGTPPPGLLRSDDTTGSLILAGSDPLPLPGQDRRVGAFGFALPGALSRDAPAGDLRRRLETLQATPATVGARSGLIRVINWNLRLRF